MKKYSVGVLRERLAEALDEADRGVPVIIERRGVRYRLVAEPAAVSKTTRQPIIQMLDRAVEDGQWTWEWATSGVKLKTGTRR